MTNALLLVHSWKGAHADFARHLPYWRRTGQFSRIVEVIGTDETSPPHPGVEQIHIAPSGYLKGDNLCRRIVECAIWSLAHSTSEWITQMEYDTLLFKPFPVLPVGLSGHLAGGRLPNCKGSFFFHGPWVADRATWQRIAVEGLQMLNEGDIENGNPDAFICWVCEKNGIPVNMAAFRSFSRNTLHFARPPHQADFSVEARQAVRDGVVSLHGCKTSATYHVDGMEMLRFITS